MKEYTLITGASSGLGLEFARIAAKEGRNLLLIARDKPRLQEVNKELSANKVAVEFLALDLSENDAAARIYKFCNQKNIQIRTLVNNAGFGDFGNFDKSDLKKQLSMIDVNIRAVTELTHLFLPSMIKDQNGKILNIASIAAFLPGPKMSVYYATKHFVLAFSEGLAEELRGSGVTVTTLCPGPTKTGFEKAASGKGISIFKGKLPTAAEVALFGWKAMKQGKRVVIHGKRNKIFIFLSRFVSRNLLARFVNRTQK